VELDEDIKYLEGGDCYVATSRDSRVRVFSLSHNSGLRPATTGDS